MDNKKVSVIIPAYNTELYVENCIESVERQTYKNIEIIVVNDGSTDKTLDRVNRCISKYNNIRLINIDNHGQGYARNIALKQSTGDYILFLDSDDFIEDITLEQCVKKIEEDESDVVVFDWKEYYYTREKYRYYNKDTFFKNKLLQGLEVTELFQIRHYFTVNKLYSKEFLISNNIKYGEGYIYEDIPFWVKVVIKKKKVSLLPSPLYNVGIAPKSTTRNNMDTKKHYNGFISAITDVITTIQSRPDVDYADLYSYIMKKFNLYYRKRVPKKYRKEFLNDYVNTMSNMVPLKNYNMKNTLIKYACKSNMFKKRKYFQFRVMYKAFILKRKIRTVLNKLKWTIERDVKKYSNTIKYTLNIPSSYNEKIFSKTVGNFLESNILFMGFDKRYTGNSRYLFEELKDKGYTNIKFVTDSNEELDEQYRIEPESKEMYKALYESRIVIFESWVPSKYRKRGKQIWIQLWHGTPLKKMLFDSDEGEIIEKSPGHKIQKYNDINRWDYLLSDNPVINRYFRTSFLIDPEKIINYGYPRVKYLIDNKNNEELKQKIREKVGVNKNKQIVLYLPTWRDYNYGKEEKDFDRNYILDTDRLKEVLGSEYEVLEKNHTYLQGDDKKVMHNTNIETQELLLIADYLITDYSSVMFDGFAIDIPVLIYANDFEKYQNSRGVYEDMWENLREYVSTTVENLADMIQNYDRTSYENLKEKYAYKNICDGELGDFIEDQLIYKVK